MFARRPLEDLNRCIGDLGTANVRFRRQNMLLDAALANVHRQKEQLDVAVNNMSQGLAMFDAEQRLVVCNKLYAEMYGLSADLAESGVPLQRIADQLVAGGCYSETSADDLLSWMRHRLAGKEGPHHVSALGDGRSIAVLAQQMPGGGIVTTHQDITEQRLAEAKIVHMALHDTLTGLPNRVLLDERLEQALTRVRRGEVVAVHMLDLDHFKAVNDTLGHPAGDRLLKTVTERLRALVRERTRRASGATSSPSSRSPSSSPPMPPRWRSASSRLSASPTRSTAIRSTSASRWASPWGRPTVSAPPS